MATPVGRAIMRKPCDSSDLLAIFTQLRRILGLAYACIFGLAYALGKEKGIPTFFATT
jgi:hypothetical protein